VRRRRRTIALFLVCAAAVLGAMTWLSRELLAMERREAASKAELGFQETIRLALLRMDSMLASSLLTYENMRPYFHYAPFYSADQAWTKLWEPVCVGDVQQSSPLLRDPEPRFCRLHFQIDPLSGTLTSPRLPPYGEKRGLAQEQQFVDGTDLARVSSLIDSVGLIAPTPRLIEIARRAAEIERSQGDEARRETGSLDEPERDDPVQRRRGARSVATGPQAHPGIKVDPQGLEPTSTKLYPVWFRGGAEWQLILLRTVHIPGEEDFIQGVWVDWPRLRHALLERIKDRIPDADLEPMPDIAIESDRKLAGIPALLVAKPPPAVAVAGVTPTRVTLSVAWAGVIAAVIAIGLVLRAIIDIGERRGRFVSAVTHELRTPLTTFCLYSQMLADNMVREEPKRGEYLATLKRESQRLAKIVENVLYFARLSEVRASVANEPVEGAGMLDRIVPVLARRASESGMTLDWDLEAARGAVVRADPQTLERILANLVDNACKYAKDFARPDGKIDNRIHVRTRAANGMLEIQVADHGPGIARANRRRAFRAFNRTDDTSNTAPGLGLGLSLARGLAKSLRGDLRIVGFGEGGQGAVLALTIPAEATADEGVLARA